MWRHLVWFQVLCLVGCASTLTREELSSAADARWKRAVCTTPPKSRIVWTENKLHCGPLADAWGCHVPAENTLYLSVKIPEDKRLQVMTHEKGHLLAPYEKPRHTEPGTGIMSAYIDDAAEEITAADINLICKEANCRCRNPE
jgi:hypothetical protein